MTPSLICRSAADWQEINVQSIYTTVQRPAAFVPLTRIYRPSLLIGQLWSAYGLGQTRSDARLHLQLNLLVLQASHAIRLNERTPDSARRQLFSSLSQLYHQDARYIDSGPPFLLRSRVLSVSRCREQLRVEHVYPTFFHSTRLPSPTSPHITH